MDPAAYPVRTPLAYWLVVGVLFGLAAGAGYVCALALAQGVYSWKIVGLGGLVVAAPVIYFLTTAEYRARGEIRVGTAHVEVPDGRGAPVRFASAGLQLTFTRVIVRYMFTVLPLGEVPRGVVIELREGARRRRISTLVLVDPRQGEALVADLERVRRGLPPEGPRAQEEPPSRRPERPRDEHEAQLDRELAAMD
ncbi:hypothetical protein SAMN02745121_02357 [Nannocystis exedens]|uniref:Uncharacterized protein n=1 Tax=Nannocystis exedens TaxID=54 RepID=A0A1I1WHJ5_9BACT|nr:hypothetical protein [Nannocystis exedens]PCC67720.1 hypothetical protein NAEX_00728 [Nannocystis exedens]SFD94532.1 hypothetical protein SAMN02745121_02357 [Nannocystis exedens]